MIRMFSKDSDAIPAQRRTTWRRAAILVLLAMGLAALATSRVLHAALIEVLAASDAIIATHPVLGAMLFVAFAALSAMLAFASVGIILPVAVYTWGEPLSILLLWIGWILGGAFSFLIGRYLGRPVVQWLTAESLLTRLERHLGPSTPFSLVLLFQFALPSEIPGYVLGLVRYSFVKYLLALGLVELLYAVLMVEMGAGFVERRAGTVLFLGITAALLSVTAFGVLRRRMS
jgi:uncharacterized membrane protein YdjX (TVP38/TMEM64 family)